MKKILKRGAILVCALFGALIARADLRLVCEIDGRVFVPASVSERTIKVSNGTETRQVGADGGTWRLEGDLRKGAPLLLMSPKYQIYRQSFRDGEPDKGRPLRAVVTISHGMRGRVSGTMTESEFLEQWPEGVTGHHALLATVWMIKGRAADVRVHIIPPTQRWSRFMCMGKFDLTREQAAGQPVVLLWKDGKFATPRQASLEGIAPEAVQAVIFDDVARLHSLLDAGLKPAVAAKNSGLTLLHLAAEAGSLRAMDILLKTAPKLVRTEAKESHNRILPLELAIEKNRSEAVARLLRAKAAFNLAPTKRGFARTPFTTAVHSGDARLVRLLLQAGANPFDPKTADVSAFDLAVIGGDVGIVEMLLGGKPLPPKILDDYKESDALRYQLRKGRLGMALWLLDRGVPINDNKETLRTLLEMAGKNDDAAFADLVAKAVRPPSPGASNNRTQTTAPPEPGTWLMPDPASGAPMVYAAGRTVLPDNAQTTALAEAARANYPLIIQKLIDAGFPVNEAGPDSSPALHEAAAANAVESMRVLMERGASIDSTDSSGATALDRALANDAAKAARLLAAKGARINTSGKAAEKSFEAALRMDIPELVMPMVDAGHPAGGKLHNLWTLRRAATHYGAQACLHALDAQPKSTRLADNSLDDTSVEPEGPVREFTMEVPAGEDPDNNVVDPRNPLRLWPQATVKLGALVDASGYPRFCTVLLAGDDPPPPAMLQRAASRALEKSKLAPLESNGVPEPYWLSATVRFPARSNVGGKSTDEIDAPFTPIEPRAQPDYPPDFERNKKKGDVILFFVVAKNGRVEQMDVLKGTSGFSEAAKAAVRRWHFHPAKKDGIPTSAETIIPIHFEP